MKNHEKESAGRCLLASDASFCPGTEVDLAVEWALEESVSLQAGIVFFKAFFVD